MAAEREPVHMRFGRTGAKTTGKIVEKAINIPFVDKMTGWAVEESIVYLLERGEAIRTFRKDCEQLKELLSRGNNAHRTQNLLEEMADMPTLSSARDLLRETCAALTEVNLVVAMAEARKAQGLMSGAMHRVMSSFTYETRKRLKDALKKLSSDENFLQLLTAQGVQTLVRRRDPCGPGVSSNDQQLRPLTRRPEKANKPNVTHPPQLPEGSIVQHCDGFLSAVYNLLASVRNVLIVGMGGIGKTTVARALWQRAEAAQQFDHVVWLNVGRRPDVLKLLIDAFSRLFGAEYEPDFSDACNGVRLLARRVHDEGWSVLLVLDDVWAISEPGIIDALNFATIAGLQIEGSRLIVTTRQACTELYAAHKGPTTTLEYETVEVPPLSMQSAQQLFHHLAFSGLPAGCCWADDRLCPEQRTRMIHACGGNPGAVVALVDVVRNLGNPNAWAGELQKHEDKEVWDVRPPRTTWASSVDALPESVKACFIAFAAFQPDTTGVTEADVLHLFATNAPLHTAESVRAAGSKLEQLVQHNLVSAEWRDGRCLFSMHPILRRIARSRAGVLRGSEGPLYHFEPAAEPSKESLDVQSLSVHKAQDTCVSEALQHYRRKDHKLHVCVISQVKRTPPPVKWPPRLRYLHLGRQWACGWKTATRMRAMMGRARTSVLGYTGTACPVVLHSLSLPSSTVSGEPLQCLLPARQLLHLDLSGCASLTELPPCVLSCTQLVHLNLHGCSSLEKLPEQVGDCTSLLDLDLGGCECLQKLPEEIGKCKKLVQLDMSGCSHASQQDLPAGIVDCINLTNLDLSGCVHLAHLTAGILTTAMQLKHIDLSACSQLQLLPPTMANCNSLECLKLSDCSSLTELPRGIGTGDCTMLADLDLSGCTGLTGLPEAITNLINLTHLDLSSCHSLAVPPSLAGCEQLIHVLLCNNTQLQHVPAAISSHVNLAHVDCSGCTRLQGLPQPFQSTQLTRLDLRGCSSLQQFPASSDGYSNLMHLDADGCSTAVSITRLPQWIGTCSQLTHLSLRGCSNVYALPESICSCSELAHLCLSGCAQLWHLPDHIGGLGPVIEGCRRLSHIDLTGCTHLSQLPPSISDCSELAYICLNGCSQLIGLPCDICRCAQLTRLDLSGCTGMPDPPRIIDGELSYLGLKRSCSLILQRLHVAMLPQGIVDSLGPQLIELDLTSCRSLTGLPDFRACKQLTRLCLRDCYMLADLPDSIGDCVQLAEVDLRGCIRLMAMPLRLSECRLLKIKLNWGCPALSSLNPNDASVQRLVSMIEVCKTGKSARLGRWGCWRPVIT